MHRKNPWKTLDSRIVYQNPWITVREDNVIRPDGLPGIYGVVETRVATGVIALTAEQEVVLVGQYRYPTNRYSWEIVEGGNDPDEPALEAAKRELKEETGITAAKWQQLGGEIQLSNCHSSEIAVLFLAEDLSYGDHAPEGTEVLEVRKIPMAECLALVDSGEIQDALSIIGLERLRARYR